MSTVPHRLSPLKRAFDRRALAAYAVGVLVIGGSAWALTEKPAAAAPPAAATPVSTSTSTSPSISKTTTAAPALSVSVTAPTQQTLARNVSASGSIAARDELSIGADAAGVRLVEVLVDVGSRVQRGQLLARGDDAQLRTQLAQQEALVKQARAELAQADSNLERAERIRDSGIYSVETVQGRRTSAQAAAAKLELADAQRRELEVRIAHTRVLAPAAGIVSKRSATLGAVMQSGQELFRMIRDEEVEWLAELPDHALARVRIGAPAKIALDDGRKVTGTVRLVAPTIDTKSRNGLVYVALPPGAPLKAGGHARGEIEVGSSTVLTLPEAVVLNRDGQPFVFVLGADSVAQLKRIETGERQRGLVEVTGGLDAGSKVVATGAGFVKDGERVRVAPSPSATPPAAQAAAQAPRSTT